MKEDLPEASRADSFLRMIRRDQRGRLKIYLGYGAGVGKTYQMLLEGHRLKAEGIDVVAALVETHGRIETARLIEGLEVIPRSRQEYRGVTLEEMDVDAVLARKPQVALIDELAHTNVPGSRNPKRYQDVQDILSAGIHVITTLNIQHLESLYDTVEKAIRVKVRERIPDTVVAEADEIVNVDLSSEDLRERLQEGKIYPADRIGTALANFFTDSNLETLRELTLRELAAHIDLRRREHIEEKESTAPDQVMVCLSSRGPNSETLLRYGSRLAGRLNRNWYAVYVQTPSEEPTIIDSQTQRILQGTLTLAKELGAMVFTYKGEDIAQTILRFAKEYRVGHIVIGSPGSIPVWQRCLGRRSVVDRLIDESRDVTVVVCDTRKEEPESAKTPRAASIQAATEPAVSPDIQRASLATFLSPRRIVIWEKPAPKETILRTLTAVAAADIGQGKDAAILDAILEREQEASTFLNEGVAFPHILIAGIGVPLIALGVTRQGISDVHTEAPIELTFLILSPTDDPSVQVRLLALVAQTVKNRQLLQALRSAATPEEVFRALLSA